MREVETRSIQLYLKLFLLLFLLHARVRLWFEIRERNDMRVHVYVCVYTYMYIYIYSKKKKKKEKKFIARLVEGSETYVHPCLRMNVKSVLKIHFPRQGKHSARKKSRFYSASNYLGVVNPQSSDRKRLEDYTMRISDYNI